MQLSAIHVVKNQANLSDEEYRKVLRDVAGASSSKELDETGIKDVYRRICAIAAQKQRDLKNDNHESTSKKIWALWYEFCTHLPDSKKNTKYLAGIIRRAIYPRCCDADNQVDDPSETWRAGTALKLDYLENRQTYKVIEALKLRIEQEEEKYAAQHVPF